MASSYVAWPANAAGWVKQTSSSATRVNIMQSIETEKLLKYLSASVAELFSTMFGTEVKKEKQSIKVGAESPYDYSAIMALTGDISGNVVLSLPNDTANALTMLMLGQQASEDTAYAADATGELLNMVVGSFLGLLSAEVENLKVEWTVPTIVAGKNHLIWHRRDLPCTVIQYSSDCGPFTLEVSLRTPATVKPGGRILLADDDRHARKLFGRVLIDEGYSVTFATEGYEAVVALRDQDIDLVLTDLKMPNVAGVEVVEKLRSLNPSIPIVVVTGFAGELGERAMDAGAAAVLEKPVDLNKLKKTLREILGQRRLL